MNEDGTTNDAEWIIKKNGLFADAYEERIRRKCEEGDIEGITEVFKNIPEIKAADQEWHMRDER